eukprot:4975897-Amphidinium_carterae.1
MPSFSPEVTVMLRSGTRKESFKKSVNTYFDSDGFLRQENIFNDVTDLSRTFEKQDKKTQ